MQTTGKAGNADASVIRMCPRNLNSKKFTMPKLLGLFTFILTAGLMLTSGNVQAGQHFNWNESYVKLTMLALTMLAANSELENTERNVRDRSEQNITPENQKETRNDRQVTAEIRSFIVKDKSLSRNAHNAKIITQQGMVTLRGPVENSIEKSKLQSIAQQIRGVKQVDNQLEIKAP